jgi:hypothetical protein
LLNNLKKKELSHVTAVAFIMFLAIPVAGARLRENGFGTGRRFQWRAFNRGYIMLIALTSELTRMQPGISL